MIWLVDEQEWPQTKNVCCDRVDQRSSCGDIEVRGDIEVVYVDRSLSHERPRSDAVLCFVFRDGVSRCGVYCVLSMTWDKLSSEHQVDVFQAVHSIKRNRPQLVRDKVACVVARPRPIQPLFCCYANVIVGHVIDHMPTSPPPPPSSVVGVVQKRKKT